MDPFTFVTGAIGLLGAIVKLTVVASSFASDVREAAAEMVVVGQELESLAIPVSKLKDDAQERALEGWLPDHLVRDLGVILHNCESEVAKIGAQLTRTAGGRFASSRWVLVTRKVISKHRSTLVAHSRALSLTLQLFSMSNGIEIRQDTQQLLTEVKSFGRILARQRPSYALQRYLEDATNYAMSCTGSVVDVLDSPSKVDMENEHELPAIEDYRKLDLHNVERVLDDSVAKARSRGNSLDNNAALETAKHKPMSVVVVQHTKTLGILPVLGSDATGILLDRSDLAKAVRSASLPSVATILSTGKTPTLAEGSELLYELVQQQPGPKGSWPTKELLTQIFVLLVRSGVDVDPFVDYEMEKVAQPWARQLIRNAQRLEMLRSQETPTAAETLRVVQQKVSQSKFFRLLVESAGISAADREVNKYTELMMSVVVGRKANDLIMFLLMAGVDVDEKLAGPGGKSAIDFARQFSFRHDFEMATYLEICSSIGLRCIC